MKRRSFLAALISATTLKPTTTTGTGIPPAKIPAYCNTCGKPWTVYYSGATTIWCCPNFCEVDLDFYPVLQKVKSEQDRGVG